MRSCEGGGPWCCAFSTFGMGWRTEQVAPWVLSVIEMLGPARCIFGSHMPIAGLSVGFERLYDAYQEIVARFSAVERDDMFRGTAAARFSLACALTSRSTRTPLGGPPGRPSSRRLARFVRTHDEISPCPLLGSTGTFCGSRPRVATHL